MVNGADRCRLLFHGRFGPGRPKRWSSCWLVRFCAMAQAPRSSPRRRSWCRHLTSTVRWSLGPARVRPHVGRWDHAPDARDGAALRCSIPATGRFARLFVDGWWGADHRCVRVQRRLDPSRGGVVLSFACRTKARRATRCLCRSLSTRSTSACRVPGARADARPAAATSKTR